eukprot:7892012-Pyramimonas_sp.AAC.1
MYDARRALPKSSWNAKALPPTSFPRWPMPYLLAIAPPSGAALRRATSFPAGSPPRCHQSKQPRMARAITSLEPAPLLVAGRGPADCSGASEISPCSTGGRVRLGRYWCCPVCGPGQRQGCGQVPQRRDGL